MYFLFTLAQLIFFHFLNYLSLSSSMYGSLFILLNILGLIIFKIKKYEDISRILVLALIIRVFFLYWDIYAKDIFALPHSGSDSEGFYRSIIYLNSNMNDLGKNIYGGVFVNLFALPGWFVNSNRLVVQYFNVIVGILIIIWFNKTLKISNTKKSIQDKATLLIAFFPHSIVFSSILLRENLILLLVTISIYNFLGFVKRVKQFTIYNLISSFILILFASSMHSGPIFILVGYMFYILFYNTNSNFSTLKPKSILFLLIALIFVGFIIRFSDTFLHKFRKFDRYLDGVDRAPVYRGGSDYLKTMIPNNIFQIIAYFPIRLLYFLGSTLPWMWRNIFDVITFFLDSTFYLFAFTFTIKNLYNKKVGLHNKKIFNSLFISLMSVLVIFATGISNAGTALRHRYKFLTLIMIVYLLSNENNFEIEEKKQSYDVNV